MFGVQEQLFEHAGQELNPGLALPGAEQGRAADLVQDCRRALFLGRVDDVLLQGVNRVDLEPPPSVPQLPRPIGAGDDDRVR